ncbi:hypothetical protein GOPIP_006_00780 [Gordonia polyisoprenivorans NBRC 16320 = JCM 10675]|uniref:Mce-associated membrane protein n=1 Tax=Gordonia polyisoprenivorans TaxID=84595 RepID=A0A846WMT2_9ACTN|nr:hypothetical protein [Gordonia polyisoprenivorans]NKY02103.1 hypothetical protein [Gordonia polyisoprenivorans]OZC31661.1 hypothetical protein CJJ17_09380 [Gordonia polyisoprenivorans]GAB21305.1 hypothetical protein GOPIP_006_00780 [Gordonia polyisoprenivorans NBRC 16320 = JCM 10675]
MRIPLRTPATRDRIVAPGAARIAATVAVVVIAALVTAVIATATSLSDQRRTADNRDSLRAHAGAIVAQVFSVDTATWQTDRARARTLVAGDFAGSFAAQLHRAPPAGTSSVRWHPDTVAIIDTGREDGDALIRATVLTRTGTGQQSTEKLTLRMGFVLRDGRWLLRDAEVVS